MSPLSQLRAAVLVDVRVDDPTAWLLKTVTAKFERNQRTEGRLSGLNEPFGSQSIAGTNVVNSAARSGETGFWNKDGFARRATTLIAGCA